MILKKEYGDTFRSKSGNCILLGVQKAKNHSVQFSEGPTHTDENFFRSKMAVDGPSFASRPLKSTFAPFLDYFVI